MPPSTPIIFNVDAWGLLIVIVTVFLGLLGIVWKAKKEISQTVSTELNPFRNISHAITEIQTILKNKLDVYTFNHSMVERGTSPLRPTAFGANLIKESGLEKILNTNKETLCIKLQASLKEEYTEYDVQENARNLLISLKDDGIMRKVKEYIYNHPMDIEVILRVGGLWLRDDFLKQPRAVAQENKSA